ncbi:ribonuclease R [Deinococcus yavapaiensis]|uniref:Ribonuclease R n=1 Tax=Deinococcus yavapaiensis KR-236 TaxID=694435 RepID=A0A318SCV2_9DEIO|nr:ribonuclease R [Deinococcus yavapaiensis]PYE55224.1 ribonuclease R [Deinococcus yavapaiensis KR-236]
MPKKKEDTAVAAQNTSDETTAPTSRKQSRKAASQVSNPPPKATKARKTRAKSAEVAETASDVPASTNTPTEIQATSQSEDTTTKTPAAKKSARKPSRRQNPEASVDSEVTAQASGNTPTDVPSAAEAPALALVPAQDADNATFEPTPTPETPRDAALLSEETGVTIRPKAKRERKAKGAAPVAPAEEAPPAEPKRTNRRKKTAATSEATSPNEGEVSASSPVDGAPSQLLEGLDADETELQPQPRDVPQAPSDPVDGVPAQLLEEAAPDPVASADASMIEEVPSAKPKRPRRGKKAEVTPAEAPAEVSPVETTSAAETPTEVAPPAKKPRRGKKAAQTEEDALPVPIAEVVTTEPAAPEAAPKKPKRGKNKKSTVEATEVVSMGDATQEVEALAREADEALEPVAPSSEAGAFLVSFLQRLGRPVHVRDLERQLTRKDREKLGARGKIEDLLEELVERGSVVRTRKRTYGLPEAMNLVRGRFQATQGGYGFVIPDAGGDDYYIAPEATMEAWNGDTVFVRVEERPAEGRGRDRERRGESTRATVVRIVARAYHQLVGTLEHSKGYTLLKADDSRARHRILLLPDGTENVPTGARVVVELFWPEDTGEDEVFGRVTRVLGDTDDPETETQAVIVKFGLRDEFPEEVLREAEAIPTSIPEEAFEGRLDLRHLNIFTVDGRDAKDFDDAIHIENADNGNFLIGVHIADVSAYVRAGTDLDKEALARATSVYLPGRVLPMLPERLSNGVCSLVPNEDRLSLSALIEVNSDGDALRVELTPSVIRSKARLTYDEVQAYSEASAALPDFARFLEGDLHRLLKITSRMRQKRLRNGSLDFKLREVKVDIDKEGNLQLIPIREETARGMIEDLMLLANKVVARHMLEKNVPALYRVHEEPTQGRFAEVSAALAKMGVTLGDEPTPQAYQAALKKVRGTPQETVANTLLLRSLKQARYAGENLGHFGLAFEEYLHFTSPIRRYPDLIVHRALRAHLTGEGAGSLEALRAELPKMGEHTSERERAAAEAERELTKYYQAKWAQAHLGEDFDGTVSGVTSFGVFVVLENGVEGLLHISNLDDDYYFFIEDALMLRGRSSGRTFRMGDFVRVQIAQVNPIARSIDFTQETDMTDPNSRPRARRRGERDQERDTKTTLAPRTPTSDGGDAGRVDGRQENREGRGDRGRVGNRHTPTERLAPPASRGGNGPKRRIVTMERPRNEHNRPIAVTVQRMYFGDWSSENLREDEASGGNPGYKQPRPSSQQNGRGASQSERRPRPQPQQAAAQPAAPQQQGDANGGGNRRRRRRRGRGKPNGTSES